jgi:hypothetical protein
LQKQRYKLLIQIIKNGFEITFLEAVLDPAALHPKQEQNALSQAFPTSATRLSRIPRPASRAIVLSLCASRENDPQAIPSPRVPPLAFIEVR